MFIDHEPRPIIPSEIELASNLTLFELLDKAGEPFDKEKCGEMLLVLGKNKHGFVEPGAIEFRDRKDHPEIPGFWIRQGNHSGSTLEGSAVVFDYMNKAIVFVYPGADDEDACGVKISASLHVTEFSGPKQVFEKTILDAKAQAVAALPPRRR